MYNLALNGEETKETSTQMITLTDLIKALQVISMKTTTSQQTVTSNLTSLCGLCHEYF